MGDFLLSETGSEIMTTKLKICCTTYCRLPRGVQLREGDSQYCLRAAEVIRSQSHQLWLHTPLIPALGDRGDSVGGQLGVPSEFPSLTTKSVYLYVLWVSLKGLSHLVGYQPLH